MSSPGSRPRPERLPPVVEQSARPPAGSAAPPRSHGRARPEAPHACSRACAPTSHLLRQITIRLGGRARRVVLQHRAALDGRFGVPHGLADPRLVDELAEVLLEDLDRLARVQCPAVVHRGDDPLDADPRVQVLTHHRQRVLELDEPAQREVLALDGNDHARGGDERVDRQQAERRRCVDQDEVVLVAHLDERLFERALTSHHRGERELGAGQVDRGDGQVDLAVLDHVRDRDLVDEHVEHRPLDRVRVHALAHGQVALRVEVDQQDAMAHLHERDTEVQRRRRLRDAALLVRERDHPDAAGAAGRRRRHPASDTGAASVAGGIGSSSASSSGSFGLRPFVRPRQKTHQPHGA